MRVIDVPITHLWGSNSPGCYDEEFCSDGLQSIGSVAGSVCKIIFTIRFYHSLTRAWRHHQVKATGVREQRQAATLHWILVNRFQNSISGVPEDIIRVVQAMASKWERSEKTFATGISVGPLGRRNPQRSICLPKLVEDKIVSNGHVKRFGCRPNELFGLLIETTPFLRVLIGRRFRSCKNRKLYFRMETWRRASPVRLGAI